MTNEWSLAFVVTEELKEIVDRLLPLVAFLIDLKKKTSLSPFWVNGSYLVINDNILQPSATVKGGLQ
nr:hypothetical protein Itr_chr11CG05840 [Ipomoea trifida]